MKQYNEFSKALNKGKSTFIAPVQSPHESIQSARSLMDGQGPEPDMQLQAGKGTFLVMDDDVILQEVMKGMLESLGYTVECKGNGKEAVDFFSKDFKNGRTIKGLIFDLRIPDGMSGSEAIAIIRKIDKNIPAFVASGYSDDPVMASPTMYGFNASLCKPFRKAELEGMLCKYMGSGK